jgi:hypothetical protein
MDEETERRSDEETKGLRLIVVNDFVYLSDTLCEPLW